MTRIRFNGFSLSRSTSLTAPRWLERKCTPSPRLAASAVWGSSSFAEATEDKGFGRLALRSLGEGGFGDLPGILTPPEV